jgi:hypothetical protein
VKHSALIYAHMSNLPILVCLLNKYDYSSIRMLNTGYYCEWVCFDMLSSKIYVKSGPIPSHLLVEEV